jgi:hypothetical protein
MKLQAMGRFIARSWWKTSYRQKLGSKKLYPCRGLVSDR